MGLHAFSFRNLIAKSIYDGFRMEMYEDMVTLCYQLMCEKLQKALDENPELSTQEPVATYIKLLK